LAVGVAVLALAGISAMVDAANQRVLNVYAAGSLRVPLLEIGRAFEARHPEVTVRDTFGASGLLKDRLMGGERADVFASANLEHPEALAAAGRAGPVQRFARNGMCALVRPGLDVTTETLVDRMLDPAVRLGTSTPRADPSGDYAWALFARVEQSGHPGARERLAAKALQLTGGPDAPPATDAQGRSVYTTLVAGGQADLFLTYCTNTALAVREDPTLRRVDVPAAIQVAASYGVAVLAGAGPDARDFVAFLLSQDGQRVLAAHGFQPP
jgi:ABC-type molybdate transport system substrate-binding protein